MSRLAYACLFAFAILLCSLCWVGLIGWAGLAAEPGHAGEVLAEDSGPRKAATTARVHRELLGVAPGSPGRAYVLNLMRACDVPLVACSTEVSYTTAIFCCCFFLQDAFIDRPQNVFDFH